MVAEIKAYNESKTPNRRAICERLHQELSAGLPEAETKIWHGAPVWFLAGNPIVGYHSLKSGIRLLFWSGQSFEESGLKNEGTFKAASATYTDVAQVNSDDIQRWLQKARDIQWDYKNLMKNQELVPVAR